MSSTAVITGIGVTAPNGLGLKAYWTATLRGESGIGPVRRFDATRYPSKLAGEVPEFDPAQHISSRLIPQTDHMTRLALAAASEALDDAGVDPQTLDEYDMGVVTAAASGGFEFGHRELANLWSQGPEYVSAYQSFAWFYAVNTGQISIRYGMRGPSGVLVSEQAGGLDAVGHARRHVRRGTPFVLSGGVDGSLCPWGWVMQLASGRLSTRTESDRAYLPFDSQACGMVPGEGGAIFIVEDAAERRGRHCYGRIAGYGASFDSKPELHREPGIGRAAELALSDAGLSAADVDAIFADAAGTVELDQAEAAALTRIFGPRATPVTAPKTMTGRLYSGGAALDVAAALLAIRDEVIPPTINVTRPDHRLDLVIGDPRPATLRNVLVLARGYGGFNAALVLAAD